MPRDADALLPADGHPRSPPPLATTKRARSSRSTTRPPHRKHRHERIVDDDDDEDYATISTPVDCSFVLQRPWLMVLFVVFCAAFSVAATTYSELAPQPPQPPPSPSPLPPPKRRLPPPPKSSPSPSHTTQLSSSPPKNNTSSSPFAQTIAAINRRFDSGRPSNHPESAGVFVRIIDHLTDTEDWEHGPWLPSKDPRRADRFSGSVINRRAPAIFMGKNGRGVPGFVLSAPLAHAGLLCGFSHDAGTVMAQCEPPGLSPSCTPGCMGASRATRNVSHWCDTPSPCHGLGDECHKPSGGRYSLPTCPWPPEKLSQLMANQEREMKGATCECCHWTEGADDCSLYNELVFSTAVLARTPAQALASVQAVFFPADRVKWVETYARQVHRALKAARRHVPLVVYNGLIDKRGPAFTAADA